MACYVCGPYRHATGLLKTKEGSEKCSYLTWDKVEGGIVNYSPDMTKFPQKTVYTKKTYKASDFCELTIRITAGDVVMLEGRTYDGTELNTPITGKFEIKFAEQDYVKGIEEGKDGVELIDLDKKEKTKENNEKNF